MGGAVRALRSLFGAGSRTRNRLGRASLGLALVAFTALILAACGGSGGSSSSSTTTTEEAATTASKESPPAEISQAELVASAEPSNEALEEGAGPNWAT